MPQMSPLSWVFIFFLLIFFIIFNMTNMKTVNESLTSKQKLTKKNNQFMW